LNKSVLSSKMTPSLKVCPRLLRLLVSFCRVVIGCAIGGQTYAFTCLNLENKNVQDLTDVMGIYKHLREVNLSNNDVKDISEASRLDYLVSLKAHHNKISNVSFFNDNSMSMQYLQVSKSSNGCIQIIVEC
jgi:Leucine-rich repeat (LRR) protein